jgi:hypothetical protein
MIWKTLIVVFGGLALTVWILASCIGFIGANRFRNWNALVGWTGSLVGAGITLSLYIHWLNEVFA